MNSLDILYSNVCIFFLSRPPRSRENWTHRGRYRFFRSPLSNNTRETVEEGIPTT